MSEITCRQAQGQLAALLDGELTERKAARLQVHLAGCAACRRHREELAAVRVRAQTWEVQGGEVWEAVRREIAPVALNDLMTEMAALRADLQAMRAEVAALRRELAARPPEPARRPSAPLFPALTSQETPLRIV